MKAAFSVALAHISLCASAPLDFTEYTPLREFTATVAPQGLKHPYLGHGHKARSTPRTEVILTALPHTYLPEHTLPASFDWRNVNGTDFTTVNRNQHIPHYCGSCWAASTTSVLSDRYKIAKAQRGLPPWPQAQFNLQVLINCGPSFEDGCHGGDPNAALEYIHNVGLPDETCQNYQARNYKCDDMAKCMNCAPNKQPGADLLNGTCFPHRDYKSYKVAEYGTFTRENVTNMEHAMMAEIYARGPIICQMACPPSMSVDHQAPGIMWDRSGFMDVDHDIGVVGWGEENGTKYWTIRNSWGSYWGEGGFFRLVRGVNNLNIESMCSWGVPVVP